MPPPAEEVGGGDDGDDDGDDGDNGDGENSEETQTTGTPAVVVTSTQKEVDPALEKKRKEEIARSFLVGTSAMPTAGSKGRKNKKVKGKGKKY